MLDSFVSKLQVVLQLRTDGVNDQTSILEQGADDLGIDSLVAVEVRSWFLKELHVDMPVLKILGGASVGDLLTYTLEKLPEELAPNLTYGMKASTTLVPGIGESHFSSPIAQDASPRSLSTSVSSRADLSIGNREASATSSSSVSDKNDSDLSVPEPVLQRIAKMSFGQSRFWFLKFYLTDQTTFNITCSVSLKGNLRLNDFEDAVKTVGQTHEALRTCFFTDESQQPRQGILETSALHLEKKPIANEDEVAFEFAKVNRHIYDLERGETIKIILLSESTISHFIIIGYHHIVMDGVSLQILISDLERAYNRRPLSHDVCQYPKFSSRQREEFESGGMKDEFLFWREEFPDFPPSLSLLPFAKANSRRPVTQYDFNRVDFRISLSLAARIKKVCRKSKTTPFHFYLACFKTLLFRFLGNDDLCVGMADANRGDGDVLGSIGLFLNLLPLRLRSRPTQTFTEALKEARTKVYAALGHSKLPFDALLQDLNVPRSDTHSPLFQAFIDYRPGVQDKRPFGNCHMEGQEYEVGRSAYDISLDIIDNVEGNALLLFMVQKDLYEVSDAEILMKSYINLLEAFAANPASRLDQPSLYNAADIDEALKLGKGPSSVFSMLRVGLLTNFENFRAKP